MPIDANDVDKCECVSCGECGGSGAVWFAIDGKYLGNSRCDDLDMMETCEECGGSGVVEVCCYCADAMEVDYAD